ncbi:DNA packaging tegument protein UL25 [Canid alphaherpesvirus 1]|uniref:DNA packaging tegument protein UL25 n=1 Tax=Canid alphaherpesvirus 1 TaxID=170325 RepID=A0A172DSY8_9ALPH|nr:DNA packaging tegument protein UL25 [Canid alphaherpesvirus 1]ALL25910.1 DNA packaging tegument protein UL25 [Canid alphaherpesvirus 1]ALL26066.1 DNA packaging tegument protein UL25 [Canid alphaherpesvirus 1]ARE29839.1 DNA packaging tegument protein UL25 [Canid alphaherpesvirus 1]QQL08508.1 DNA packaging tegument protein UL25 [Canid alphaherpesvirus 1]QQL08583.1 DNA packaging tegument protein UL25 [Canid alphaherpesvirus 1]
MSNYVSYVFDAIRESNNLIIPSDIRNFIAPAFPINYWNEPVFNAPIITAEQRLEVMIARRTATVAALDNLSAQAMLDSGDIEKRLYPLEKQVSNVAKALSSLEESAKIAEDADIENDDDTQSESTQNFEDETNTPTREVQITKIDTPLEYDTNLATDFLTMVYIGRGAGGSNGVVFGPWYRSLQDKLILDRPLITRSLDFRDGRISKTFMLTAIMSLQSCSRLYIGNRPYSAFECAVLCLHLVYRELNPNSKIITTNFIELLEQLPLYLDSISQSLGETISTRVSYMFNIDRLPRNQFHAPNGGRYERNALNDHSILKLLLKLKILPAIPGSLGMGTNDLVVDLNVKQTAYVDPVNNAAAVFLSRAQNLFLTEDQTLLRSSVNTITALLLLRRLLWNGNIYTDKLRNNFQLGTLIPGNNLASQLTRGTSNGDTSLNIKSGNNNLMFLCKNYIIPIYQNTPNVEITQLFPGLSALCLDSQAIKPGNIKRQTINISSGRFQNQLIRLISLELENKHKSIGAPIAEVITTHDAVTLQYEHGLGLLMQQPRIRAALEENNRLSQFNVNSDYDILYFLCLGFIPQYTSAI